MYRQRLGGALEELNRIVSEFDREVQRQRLTRAEASKRLEDADRPARSRRARRASNLGELEHGRVNGDHRGRHARES
jgi:hypothetical protein